jgi:hypothetical protein
MEILYVSAFLLLFAALIVGLRIRASAVDRESKWINSVAGIAVLLAIAAFVFGAIALVWVFTMPS